MFTSFRVSILKFNLCKFDGCLRDISLVEALEGAGEGEPSVL
jgi:hypothetical protein